MADWLAPNSTVVGDVQALRSLHLGQQCRRELYM
jgi:hypothetical protein